jgi:hypothetical protein
MTTKPTMRLPVPPNLNIQQQPRAVTFVTLPLCMPYSFFLPLPAQY